MTGTPPPPPPPRRDSDTGAQPAPRKETVNATPIGDSLQKHLDDVLTKIPSGKRGTATVGVSTTGVVAEVGTKFGQAVTVSGWAGKTWGGSGWSAGARAAVVW